MHPTHLFIAATYPAANEDAPAPLFGTDLSVRLAKRWVRRRPGASHLELGMPLAWSVGNLLVRARDRG